MRLNLPVPPSTNNLFINIAGKGRVPSGGYKRWREAAAETLWQQKIKHFDVPVALTITVEDKGRRDVDNFAKAICDFLVRHEIIQDDSRKYVRRMTVQFGDVKGCVVEVSPA